MSITFGPLLKTWRERRRLSQLDLGLAADVSARHVSFLEQGRAQPSRAMVLRLTRHLDVPLAERNAMLHAAGFTGHFKARPQSSVELAPINAAIARMLDAHAPYPAFALDRHWHVVQANPAATALFAAVSIGTDEPLFALFLDPVRTAVFENAAVLRGQLALRLKTESAHLGGDAVLDAAAVRLLDGLDDDDLSPPSAVITTRLRFGDQRLALFGMVAQFGSTADIAIADLKIELMFPADEATRLWLEAQPRPA